MQKSAWGARVFVISPFLTELSGSSISTMKTIIRQLFQWDEPLLQNRCDGIDNHSRR